jgi:hypothetical protein
MNSYFATTAAFIGTRLVRNGPRARAAPRPKDLPDIVDRTHQTTFGTTYYL